MAFGAPAFWWRRCWNVAPRATWPKPKRRSTGWRTCRPMTVRRCCEITLLRLRALLARARGDDAAYRDLRDRYRAMAESLGYEGHIAWAEAMIEEGVRRGCALATFLAVLACRALHRLLDAVGDSCNDFLDVARWRRDRVSQRCLPRRAGDDGAESSSIGRDRTVVRPLTITDFTAPMRDSLVCVIEAVLDIFDDSRAVCCAASSQATLQECCSGVGRATAPRRCRSPRRSRRRDRRSTVAGSNTGISRAGVGSHAGMLRS